METRLLLLRHPQTEANVNGRFVGRGDTPYTELGELQRDLLGGELIRFAPERIVSSPIRRAADVALGASEVLGCTLTFDERATELDFGIAEGATYDELASRGIHFDFKSADAPVAPGGESRLDILARSAELADEQLAEGGRVAIVTHGGVFRSVIVHVLRLPLDAIWAFDIQPAQVAEFTGYSDRVLMNAFRRPEGERVL